MSNKINHRRTGQRRDSKMPRWRRTQTICNGAQGVAKGRRRWKRLRNRRARRTVVIDWAGILRGHEAHQQRT